MTGRKKTRGVRKRKTCGGRKRKTCGGRKRKTRGGRKRKTRGGRRYVDVKNMTTSTKHQGCPDGVDMNTKEFDDKHENAINLYKEQTGSTEALHKIQKRGPGGRPMGFINEATPGFRAYIKEECPILIPPTPKDPCYFDYPTKEKCQAVGADVGDENCKCSWLVDSTLPSDKRCKQRKTPGKCMLK